VRGIHVWMACHSFIRLSAHDVRSPLRLSAGFSSLRAGKSTPSQQLVGRTVPTAETTGM
jgi:hypothetical protein